jgi:mannosyl-oligosaccharide alpha-1,2-mannosidase
MHRPKTVESLFIAFRLTGNKRYHHDGWRIFQSIQMHCRVESGGYASIINVDRNPAEQEDKMETFLMVCESVNMQDVPSDDIVFGRARL